MFYPALSPVGQALRSSAGQWIAPYRSPEGAVPTLIYDFDSAVHAEAGKKVPPPLSLARLGRASIDGGGQGLLIEPARTNLITQSIATAEDWSGVGPVVLQTLALEAFGLCPGLRIESGGQVWHRATAGNVGFAANTAYAVQLWYEETAGSQVKLTLYSNATTPTTNLELLGAVGAIAPVLQNNGVVRDVRNTDLGGGLHRLSFVFEVSQAVTTGWGIGPGSATAGDAITVLAFQLEAGEQPTSFIETNGAPQTRTADANTISSAGWGADGEGTVAIDLVPHGTQCGLVTLSDGASAISLFVDASGELGLRQDNGAPVDWGTGFAVGSGLKSRISLGWGGGTISVSANGLPVQSTAVVPMGRLTQIGFSSEAVLDECGPVVVHSVRLFDGRLPDLSLVSLSSAD